MLQKIAVLYRDASNYKAMRTMTVETEQPFAVNDEIEMEHLGLIPQRFVPQIMGFEWSEDDHNILEVTELLPEDAETEYHLTYKPH